jgi:hypothetical protein
LKYSIKNEKKVFIYEASPVKLKEGSFSSEEEVEAS